MKPLLVAFAILIASFSAANAERTVLCKIGGKMFEISNMHSITFDKTRVTVQMKSGAKFTVNGINNFCMFMYSPKDTANLMQQFKKYFGPVYVINSLKEE